MIIVEIVVSDITRVMENFTHIGIFRTSSRDGVYQEITTEGYGADARISLVAGQTKYVYNDQSGTAGDWYRSAFFNANTGVQSLLSEPIFGLKADYNQPGQGTFVNGYGFDGTQDLPATGGERTNRNVDGYGTKGYWDGVQNEILCTTPLTPKGQCFKDKCVAMARVLLKDTDPACVVAGTLIKTKEGQKPVELIEEDDLVWTYDPKLDKYYWEKVIATQKNIGQHDGTLLKITTKRGRENTCTKDHPWLIVNKGTIRADAVEVGDQVYVEPLESENDIFDIIISVEEIQSNEDVFDFTVLSGHYNSFNNTYLHNCWAFSEDEIDMYLEWGLSAFNAEPTFTNFQWHDLEDRWLHIIAMGAQVFALYAQGLIEVGREFAITDNGVSFNPPQISNYMQTTASQIMAMWDATKQRIKQNMKPMPQGIGVFLPLAVHPQLVRLRHLREKRLF